MVQARAQAWLVAFPQAPQPRYRRADSTLYHAAHATHLRPLGCRTRLPHPMGSVAAVITPALAWDGGPRLEDPTREQRLELGQDGMAPRWLGVSSQAADERAAATLHHARPRERAAIHPQLLHLPATRFTTPEAAHEALTAWATGWTYHQLDSSHRSDHTRHARQGRPTPRLPVQAIDWHIPAHVRPADAAMEHPQQRHACCVMGTTSGTREWQDTAVITAYTRQSPGEGGCRFRTDPRFFVASWFVKKPCRIQGLVMVMTLALLV